MTDKNENPRILSPDEKSIWKKVARTIAPRKSEKGHGASRPLFSIIEFENMLRLPVERKGPKEKNKLKIEINQDKKTRRGRVQIEAQIDLHDMTQPQARTKLHQMIKTAKTSNKKCILVITGKGLRGEGVLRGSFVKWVNDSEVRDLIATYASAHKKHGGIGAWYIFLKD
ncbi:MAG: Smr/MutS family protein [Hellea sp.]|nr:Smr/MutS family protein [Hellea sp.]